MELKLLNRLFVKGKVRMGQRCIKQFLGKGHGCCILVLDNIGFHVNRMWQKVTAKSLCFEHVKDGLIRLRTSGFYFLTAA